MQLLDLLLTMNKKRGLAKKNDKEPLMTGLFRLLFPGRETARSWPRASSGQTFH